MNVIDLKNKCNADFDRAMTLIEKGGDFKQVRSLLLDVAQQLVDIGKLSVPDRIRSGEKARLVLEATRQLTSAADFPAVYRMLTGNALPMPSVPQNPTTGAANKPSTAQSGTKAGRVSARKSRDGLHPTERMELRQDRKRLTVSCLSGTNCLQYPLTTWRDLPMLKLPSKTKCCYRLLTPICTKVM